jgi:hypothetical protein
MRSRTELQERTNAVTLETLQADADMALTLLDLADTTRSAERRMRRRKAARKAYLSILRFLPKLAINDQQRAAMEQRLGSLRRRLLRAA